MLSPAVEDYLKTIYKLQENSPPADEGEVHSHAAATVATTEIAKAMDVSSASVTNMLKRLDQMGMVVYQSYRGVTLTDAGRKIALEIIRHHRLLELYLKEIMGYSWADLHDEAEHLEHHISEAFEDRIDEMLGYPTHDPHGDPIPTRDGQVEAPVDDPLSEAQAGARLEVRRVSDTDPELLHYLEELGLLPGAQIQILKKAPFDGPITIQIDQTEQTVGFVIAQKVFVTLSGL